VKSPKLGQRGRNEDNVLAIVKKGRSRTEADDQKKKKMCRMVFDEQEKKRRESWLTRFGQVGSPKQKNGVFENGRSGRPSRGKKKKRVLIAVGSM